MECFQGTKSDYSPSNYYFIQYKYLIIKDLFYGGGRVIVGWISFLTFKLIITTNKFNPSPYYKDYKHRIPIHNRIKELMNEGLGYKRIHKVLVKEGFEVGKSPNCVNSMIKKRLKREEFLNQRDEVEYKEFKIMVMRKV